MQHRKYIIGLAVGAAFVGWPVAAMAAKSEVKVESILTTVPMDASVDYYNALPQWAVDSSVRDTKIAKTCSPTSSQDFVVAQPEVSFIGVVFSFLIGPIINAGLDAIDKGLEKELAKYSTSYSDTLPTFFYDTSMVPAWNCFRFTRVKTTITRDNKGNVNNLDRSVEMDLIAQMHVNSKIPAMQFRPLRLFYGEPASKGSEIGLAVSVSADAVWQTGSEGRAETLFNSLLLKEKVQSAKTTKTGQGAVHYFCETEIDLKTLKPVACTAVSEFQSWEKRPHLPLVSWSTGSGPDSAFATFKVTAAEVGDSQKKKVLKVVKSIFSSVKDDLSTVLTEAAKALVAEDTPPATPKTYTGSCSTNADQILQCSWGEAE